MGDSKAPIVPLPEDNHIQTILVDVDISALGSAPTRQPKPVGTTSRCLLVGIFSSIGALIASLHVARTHAAHEERVRVALMHHVMNVADRSGLAHLAGVAQIARIFDPVADPSGLRYIAMVPLSSHGIPLQLTTAANCNGTSTGASLVISVGLEAVPHPTNVGMLEPRQRSDLLPKPASRSPCGLGHAALPSRAGISLGTLLLHGHLPRPAPRTYCLYGSCPQLSTDPTHDLPAAQAQAVTSALLDVAAAGIVHATMPLLLSEQTSYILRDRNSATAPSRLLAPATPVSALACLPAVPAVSSDPASCT